MEKIETSLTETEVNMDTFLDEGGTMDVGLKKQEFSSKICRGQKVTIHYF